MADLKSLSFVKRLALWLGREGLKVKEQDLKVEKVASHALEVVNRDRKFQTISTSSSRAPNNFRQNASNW